MKRKLMILALAATFLISIVGSALAVTPGDYFADADLWDDEFFAEAAFYLGHSGIFIGDDEGNLLPEEPFTRAHMAVVLSRLAGQERLADSMQFMETGWDDDADIPTWARGAFVLAEARGWFIGDPEGNVNPNENLTFAEIAALLTRTTGNDHLEVGTWPGSAMIAGHEMGIFDDLDMDPVPDVPVFRGDMVSMAFRASLVGVHDEEDDEWADDKRDTLLGRHYPDTWDLYHEELDTVTGTWTAYSEASQRMTVDGTRYYVRTDDEVIDVEVIVNDGTFDDRVKADEFKGTVFDDFLEDQEVTIKLDNDGEVTEIEAVYNTYEDAWLTNVGVADDEEDFGDITVQEGDTDYTLDVEETTSILLDGVVVTLAELEAALEDFQDTWDHDEPVVTARVEGNQEEGLATWVSVLMDNTVEGAVTSIGVDFIRVDGVRYDITSDVKDQVGTTDEKTFLLDSTDKIVAILDEVDPVADVYFAKLVAIGTDDQIEVELADGTETTLDVDYEEIDLDDFLGKVVLIEEKDEVSVKSPRTVAYQAGTYHESSSSWIRLFDVDGVFPLDEDVFYYDFDEGIFIERGVLEEGDALTLYEIEGVVGYVEKDYEYVSLEHNRGTVDVVDWAVSFDYDYTTEGNNKSDAVFFSKWIGDSSFIVDNDNNFDGNFDLDDRFEYSFEGPTADYFENDGALGWVNNPRGGAWESLLFEDSNGNQYALLAGGEKGLSGQFGDDDDYFGLVLMDDKLPHWMPGGDDKQVHDADDIAEDQIDNFQTDAGGAGNHGADVINVAIDEFELRLIGVGIWTNNLDWEDNS